MIFYFSSVLTAVILMLLGVNPYVAAVVTIFVVLALYITISIVSGNRRLKLLENDCDPEAFMDEMEKLKEKTSGKNPKRIALFDINIAAALIALGEFEEAKNVLLSIDESLLSRRNESLLAYTINLIGCCYGLGDIENAEKLFETRIPVLSPVTKRMTAAVKMLIAVRFFRLGRFDESREHFEKLWKEKLSTKSRLEVLFHLARLDELEGNVDAALKKYRKVAEKGNKLWIAVKAREKCEQLESR